MSNRFAGVAAVGMMLGLLPISDPGRAEPIAKPAAGEAKDATLIRDLMPPKRKHASRCFEARVGAEPIDVEDWSRVHWVPVDGQWRDGQPAKLPVAAVQKRKLDRILIQIVHSDEQSSENDTRYTLWASFSFAERKTRPLYTGARCNYRTSRLLFRDGDYVKDEKGEYISEPVTPQISCGVDCDGGGASLFYVDGAKPALRLQFRDGGMRMSGCSANGYTVGGEHDPDGQVKKSENSPGYLMTELPARACRGLERRVVDAMADAGK